MSAERESVGAKGRRRQPPTYSDTAIVLRTHKLGEADKIVRVMTREQGKRSAVAKGIRKTGSRFGARLEPLSCVRVLAHRGRSLDVVRQAEIEISFREIREDLDLFVCASAMAELIDSIAEEYEPQPELFDLLLSGLELVRDHPAHSEFTLAFFEYSVLSAAGFALRVDSCAMCGRPAVSGDTAFSLDLGGIVCGDCRSDSRSRPGRIIWISAGSADHLGWMASNRFGRLPPDETVREVERELRLFMERVLEHWLEREFRTHRVMRSMPAGTDAATGRG